MELAVTVFPFAARFALYWGGALERPKDVGRSFLGKSRSDQGRQNY
jgi:hypothetical protein